MDHTMFPADGSSSSSSSALDPLFSGISLQQLLTLNPSLLAADNLPFPFPYPSLTDDPPPQTQTQTTTTHLAEANKKQLLIPKSEYPCNLIPVEQQLQLFTSHLHPQPFNLFPKYQTPHFHRLPQLRSPEDPHRKRLRHEETISPAPAVIPQSHLARQRRQKLSEKTRCLQKLMPWDKKMDQGTLLQEAYKYVKFLQAQSSVLHSMPTATHFAATAGNYLAGELSCFGELEKLNRSQVLQVLVNSPVAQTMLYSQGLCVFSMEQVALLRKFSERKHHHHHHHQQQQQTSDDGSSKTFFN